MKHSENVKAIIGEILKVIRAREYDMIDCWLAYRLLAMQFENALLADIDQFVKEAWETRKK